MHEKNGNNPQKPKSVAIVAPTRSNSLDYLNFEEKRRLIASSLSLSDFLSVGNADAKEIKDMKDGVTAVIVGESGRLRNVPADVWEVLALACLETPVCPRRRL